MQCPVCRQRPARRSCPAKGVQICSICCGTLRGREIDCPAGCPYLAASQAHPPAAARRQEERDQALVFLLTDGLTRPQVELCSVLVSRVAAFPVDPLFRLEDEDVEAAAGSLAATLETAARGLIYDHRPRSLVAQRLYGDLKDLLAELGRENPRRLDADAAIVLRRLESAVRGLRAAPGRGGAACVEAFARLSSPPPKAEPKAAPAPPPSRLVLP